MTKQSTAHIIRTTASVNTQNHYTTPSTTHKGPAEPHATTTSQWTKVIIVAGAQAKLAASSGFELRRDQMRRSEIQSQAEFSQGTHSKWDGRCKQLSFGLICAQITQDAARCEQGLTVMNLKHCSWKDKHCPFRTIFSALNNSNNSYNKTTTITALKQIHFGSLFTIGPSQ